MLLNRPAHPPQHLLFNPIPRLISILVNRLARNFSHPFPQYAIVRPRLNRNPLSRLFLKCGSRWLVWSGRPRPLCLEFLRSLSSTTAVPRAVIPSEARDLGFAGTLTIPGCPILLFLCEGWGGQMRSGCRNHTRPRQQRLQSPPQCPPLLHLLFFLHRRYRHLLRRRSHHRFLCVPCV